jgi:RimJ/RimL family protein N-acetyltransferase
MDTANLTGRPVAESDLEFIRRVWNDDRVSPAIGGTCADEQLHDRIEGWSHHWKDHGFGTTLFRERVTGRPIGWGGLQHSMIGIGESLTVGYVIAPDEWGRGYATEIATAAVAEAFHVLGVDRVYASVLSTNTSSRRVLEKSGLSLHREIDHGDRVEVVYVVER